MRRRHLQALAFIALAATLAAPTMADTFTVTNLNDAGAGSLRQAIADANANPAAATIEFDPGLTGTIVLTSGQLPTITDDLTISGPGADELTVSGNNASRVFRINAGVTASIEGLTIANGRVVDDLGGGIFNLGTLTVLNSTFSDNTATGGGSAGGIFNFGMLTILNSTLSGNSADNGGGIFNSDGTLTVLNSTFSANSATNSGGGIFTQSGTLTVTNSTVSGNSGFSGGGIFLQSSDAVANISFTTIASNSASGGTVGGILINNGTANVKNSVIANSTGTNCATSAGGTITESGGNFATDATCPGFTQVTTGDLDLGPLADNGGPTQTHALLAGSVAIDAATDCTDVDDAAVTEDQRGLARPQGAQCDVGAFEAQPELSVVKSSLTTGLSAPQTVTYSYLVTNTGEVTLSGIGLVDDNASAVDCTATTLAVGADMTCTATHEFTQAELDANGSPTPGSGELFNEVTASSNEAPDATDSLSIPIVQDPALSVVKSSLATELSSPQTVTYSYLVTNTGNVTLTGIGLVDDNASVVSCPGTTLAVGADMTCTATHEFTQAELDANGSPVAGSGELFNAVMASSNEAPDDSDPLSIPIVQNPELSIDKTATTINGGTPNPFVFNAAGDVIGYTITATNEGNVTLIGVTVTDPQLGTLDCDPATPATLAPGASVTCTGDYTVTQSDVDTGSFTNTATADSNETAEITDNETVTAVITTASVPSATGTGLITLEISGGGPTCEITDLSATTPEAVAGGGPPGVEFPHGLVDIRLVSCTPGSTVSFTLTFPAPLPPGTQYFKFGPTPDNPVPDWYVLPAEFTGNVVTYSITDGGLGDDDLTANGVIEDPGGPGSAEAAEALPVPVTPPWALALLALLLLATVYLRQAGPLGKSWS